LRLNSAVGLLLRITMQKPKKITLFNHKGGVGKTT